MLKQSLTPARRLSSRIETHQGIWVCWRCEGQDDISPVPAENLEMYELIGLF